MWNKTHSSLWAEELHSVCEEVDMLCIYRNHLCSNADIIKSQLTVTFKEKRFESILGCLCTRKQMTANVS